MGAHILIIEDDTSLRRVLERSFTSRGFEVSVAVNGEQGLKVFKQKNPDVVFLDIVMPRSNGFQFLGLLREHLNGESPPLVIMLTNLCEIADIVQYAEFAQFSDNSSPHGDEFGFSDDVSKWRHLERYITARFGIPVKVFSKFDTKILDLVRVIQQELEALAP